MCYILSIGSLCSFRDMTVVLHVRISCPVNLCEVNNYSRYWCEFPCQPVLPSNYKFIQMLVCVPEPGGGLWRVGMQVWLRLCPSFWGTVSFQSLLSSLSPLPLICAFVCVICVQRVFNLLRSVTPPACITVRFISYCVCARPGFTIRHYSFNAYIFPFHFIWVTSHCSFSSCTLFILY